MKAQLYGGFDGFPVLHKSDLNYDIYRLPASSSYPIFIFKMPVVGYYYY